MFLSTMKKMKLTSKNIENMLKEGLYIISINEPKGWNSDDDFTYDNKLNVLTMEFGDIRVELDEPTLKNYNFEFKIFNYNDAYTIKSFIEKIKVNHINNFHLIIHCAAGVSRSAAVGLYAWEELKMGTLKEFEIANPNTSYNPIIYKKLNDTRK
jgi:predicted protein tyrosine phosphatase